MTETRKPTALIILDGWGHRDPAEDNAISNAQTPFWDKLWQNQPKTLINTSGMFVGLPQGQMGNSEVGHMNLGAGRVVYQSLTRIDKDLEDGKFQSNDALCNAIDKAVANGKAVHIMGLLSPGGVHSHEDHMLAAAEVAAPPKSPLKARPPASAKEAPVVAICTNPAPVTPERDLFISPMFSAATSANRAKESSSLRTSLNLGAPNKMSLLRLSILRQLVKNTLADHSPPPSVADPRMPKRPMTLALTASRSGLVKTLKTSFIR